MFDQLKAELFQHEINFFCSKAKFCMPGEMVRLIVNLTESRITRETAPWA